MATRVESQRNLVSIQSIAFIRSITLTLRLLGARPNTNMNIFFDGVRVNHLCAPLGGAIGQQIISDSVGAVTATFKIPGGTFTTGTKEIFVTDSDTIAATKLTGSVFGSAKANFTSTGIQQTFQTTTTVTEINTVTIEQVLPQPPVVFDRDNGGTSDPLAQSFFTYSIKGGCYLTSIDLYFNTKDASIPVRIDIRPMINGLPQSFTQEDPAYICVVPAASVNVSNDASIATNFKFGVPVYLEEDKDYCFVVFSNSRNYNLFSSKLGEKSIETGRVIFEQPYSGSLFKSENNITWQPEQFEDIKFNLNIAKFSTATNGIVKMKSVSDFFGVHGQYVSTTSGSAVVRVNQTVQHGLEVNSKVYIAVDTNATYNGIAASNMVGQRTVSSIVDEYTYDFIAGAPASSTGQILSGGQIRDIQVDVGGTGYTTVPNISITGGGGSGATAVANISNGSVVGVVVTSPGSGYTSAPTVTVTGGGGSGAVLTAIIEAAFSINTNKPTNFVVSNIPAYAAPDAKISAKLTTTQLNYVGGNLNTYQVAEVLDMTIQGRTYLNTNALIASSYNEIDRMGSNPSTLIEYSLSTTNANVSPLIDVRNAPSLISYNYRIRSQAGEDLTSSTSTGVVTQIVLLNAGSGYNVVPTVTIIGNGSGATATAVLGTTAVSTLTLTAGGAGYTSAPTVSLTGGGGSGAAGSATLAGATIASIAVTSGGSGYTSAPAITFSGGGGGTGATANAVLSTAGVASINLSSGGTGYTSEPAVALTGGGGSGATATAVLEATSVASLSLTAGGTGYTTVPTVAITGGGGTGATATATISGGAVTGLTLTSGGTGYTSTPSVSITGGGGTGATATATLTARAVASIAVIAAGSGYTSAPTVAITGGGGSGASATAVLDPRSVASVSVVNGGSGYTVVPSLIFTGGGGTGAAASATLSARAVASITLSNGGSGYTSAPTVSLTGGGGSGATATAAIAGKSIASIVVTNAGTNYSIPPEVVITRTDGSTGVDAIAQTVLTTVNSELSANRGTALSRYITKKIVLETPSSGINLFSEIYSEQQSGVDWYIRTSKSGSGVNHDNLEWKILYCDQDRNKSSKRGEVFDYQFYLYGLPEFDTYDLKCVLRSSNPVKAPEVNNYRVIIVA